MNLNNQTTPNRFCYDDLLATDFFRQAKYGVGMHPLQEEQTSAVYCITYLGNNDFAFLCWPDTGNNINLSNNQLSGKFKTLLHPNQELLKLHFSQFILFFSSLLPGNIAFVNQPLTSWLKQDSPIIIFEQLPEIDFLLLIIWDHLFQSGLNDNQAITINEFVQFAGAFFSRHHCSCHIHKRLLQHHLRSVQMGKAFILRNFRKDIFISDISAHCFVSPFHYSRIFKLHTGYAPEDYIQAIRLKQAEILLRGSAFSILEICKQSGFRRADYFSAAFKRKFHVSPLHYKSQFI